MTSPIAPLDALAPPVRAEQAIRAGRVIAIVRLPRLSVEAARTLTETLVEAGVRKVPSVDR